MKIKIVACVLFLLVTSCASSVGSTEVKPEMASTSTTATTIPSSSSSTVSSTTTTTLPEREFDVVVVGDSIGGAGVVQALVESELSVLWIPETGYIGGQATAAGVSAMDDTDSAGYWVRNQEPYAGLVDSYRSVRSGDDQEYGLAGFARYRGTYDMYAPNAPEVRIYLESVTAGSNVVTEEFEVSDVLVEDHKVVGITNGSETIRARHVVDATEFQDLYPMVAGLKYETPSCIQDTTWLVPRHQDSTLYPAESAIEAVRSAYPQTDQWLEYFSQKIPAVGGVDSWEGWDGLAVKPWSHDFEWSYRETSGGYTSLNHFNDSRMLPEAITDNSVREKLLLEAKVKTFVQLWYIRWELGIKDHGIATDFGYDAIDQMYWSDVIPDSIEKFFAPIPYIRQGRTLANPVMTWDTIQERLKHSDAAPLVESADDYMLLWGYFADSHGCDAGEKGSSFGLFPVTDEILYSNVQGFWPGMLRGSRVDEIVASSLRMQPSEYIGGYNVGSLILNEDS